MFFFQEKFRNHALENVGAVSQITLYTAPSDTAASETKKNDLIFRHGYRPIFPKYPPS